MAKYVIFFPLCSPIIQLLPVHTCTEESPSGMPAYLPPRSTYQAAGESKGIWGAQGHISKFSSLSTQKKGTHRGTQEREPALSLPWLLLVFERKKKNPHSYVILVKKYFYIIHKNNLLKDLKTWVFDGNF